MYSNKENINILTALLVAHGIRKAVVCPGSRNAAIVHNFNEHPDIQCFPVTDERSAGFYALGLAQATGSPVAVCVTSGTALLNLAPAVAEASYRHQPLVVISADRPAAWIDQLDGQTLPQPDALGRFVGKAVSLPEPKDAMERWFCNRLVNEALYVASGRVPQPVHINVPVSEPLFEFTVADLPQERTVSRLVDSSDICVSYPWGDEGFAAFMEYVAPHHPMLVIGQTVDADKARDIIAKYSPCFVVLSEPLANADGAVLFDEVLHAVGEDADYMPDWVIYIGDTIVSKRLRRFLRQASPHTVLLTTDTNRWADPTMSLTYVAECPDWDFLEKAADNFFRLEILVKDEYEQRLAGKGDPNDDVMDGLIASYLQYRKPFYDRWQKALQQAEDVRDAYEPKFSQMAVVKYFEEQLEDLEADCCIHCANSSVVRLANIYATHYVWCNRGVNGIEGSLSTAAGFALGQEPGCKVFCLIGDLSFFYDQNALWNQNLKGNLRVILLNNHGGGIFHQLPGLDDSPAAERLVEGVHTADAQGICTQNDIGYLKATTMAEMQIGMVTLLTREADRPMLLEVMTDSREDALAVKDYYQKIKDEIGKQQK